MGKIKHARAVLSATEAPDWYEQPTAKELAANRYAVVVARDKEEWVDGAKDLHEIAGIALGAAVGPEYDVEYVTRIIDLDTGEQVKFDTLYIVRVTIGGESGIASS